MLTKTRASVLAAAALAVAGYFYQPPTTPAPVPLLSAPTAKVTTLGTWDGQHYASAQPDGTLVADRTKVGAWEEFKIEPHGARISLLGAHGFYVSAQPDGTVEVNRKEANGWELWTLVPTDGGTGLQSDFGTFLVAEGGGGGAVNADRTGLGPWETFKLAGGAPGPGPAVLGKLSGLLRVQDGIAYADDSGYVLPTYAHYGSAFSDYVRRPDEVIAQLDLIAAAGHQGVRVWLTLGCGPDTGQGCPHGAYWRGREVGVEITPDYWGKLESFMAELHVRGLRLVASQGDIGQLRDRRAFMERLRRVDEKRHVTDWLDCGNEAWQTGEPDPNKLAQCVGYYGGGNALRTLTDAPIYGAGISAPDMLDRYSIAPADAFDIHSFRGGHSWDKRRHIWGYTYCGEGCPKKKVGIGSEPPGNGPRVSAIENKGELDDEAVALLALASHLGRQAFVWFSGEGVINERGLQTEAGFYSVPKAVALLPKDVYTYRTTHHSGNTFASIRVLEPSGQVRIDGRMADDGRFAYTIDGPSGVYNLRVARGFKGQLCHPGTAVCESVEATRGATLPVSFTRGRLFMGRVN